MDGVADTISSSFVLIMFLAAIMWSWRGENCNLAVDLPGSAFTLSLCAFLLFYDESVFRSHLFLHVHAYMNECSDVIFVVCISDFNFITFSLPLSHTSLSTVITQCTHCRLTTKNHSLHEITGSQPLHQSVYPVHSVWISSSSLCERDYYSSHSHFWVHVLDSLKNSIEFIFHFAILAIIIIMPMILSSTSLCSLFPDSVLPALRAERRPSRLSLLAVPLSLSSPAQRTGKSHYVYHHSFLICKVHFSI